MKQFNVWTLENSEWVPFLVDECDIVEAQSRKLLSIEMRKTYRLGTFKIRLAL
jgi:hypothetical protein